MKKKYNFSTLKCAMQIPNLKKKCCSEFDLLLRDEWNSARQNKLFRYDLEALTTKYVKKHYCFVVQLNSKRAFERREPQQFEKMHKPFDMNLFNFTKVNPKEILFEFYDDIYKENNYIIINVSPLEYGNVLFVPNMKACLPQILTKESITLAIEMILSSSHPGFRIAYNSQLASASVNHLHLHAYYIDHTLITETLEVELIRNHIYITPPSYPMQGFMYVLHDITQIENISNSVYELTNKLELLEVPHNLFMTHGIKPIDNIDAYNGQVQDKLNDASIYDCIRIYVWPRKPNYANKLATSMNVAACEISGHILVKDEEGFNLITYEEIIAILNEFSYTRDETIKFIQCKKY